MFECIRTLLMVRIRKNREKMTSHPIEVCPRIEEKLKHLGTLAPNFISLWSGGNEYQVSSGPDLQFVVNLKYMTCSCRVWELSGMPYVHVCVCNQ